MKTNKIEFILFLGFASLILSSCQTLHITPGSERIRVFETEPKNCIFAGEISSVQEDVTVVAHAEPEMSLETRTDLRNKAYTLGGNVLVFMKSKDKKAAAGVAQASPVAPAKKGEEASTSESSASSERKISTTFLATTFRCPASIVNQ